MNTTVYVAGIALQAVAACIALAQVRRAPRRLPWLLIALSSLMIVVRRAATLEQFMTAGRPLAWGEVLTLLVSALFLIGVVLMSRMFREAVAAQETLRDRDAALRSREDLLKATQRLTKVGGWEWDVARQTMTWTDEVYRIHGMTPGEVAPGSPDHIARSAACYEPQDRPKILAAFQRCVEHGEPYDMEFPFTTVQGRTMWIRTTAESARVDGRVTRVIGNIMDITERRRAEQALQANVQELRDALEHIKTLRGIIPICMNCKKVRNDQGYWQQVEVYVRDHSDAEFSHGVCPECAAKLYPKSG